MFKYDLLCYTSPLLQRIVEKYWVDLPRAQHLSDDRRHFCMFTSGSHHRAFSNPTSSSSDPSSWGRRTGEEYVGGMPSDWYWSRSDTTGDDDEGKVWRHLLHLLESESLSTFNLLYILCRCGLNLLRQLVGRHGAELLRQAGGRAGMGSEPHWRWRSDHYIIASFPICC